MSSQTAIRELERELGVNIKGGKGHRHSRGTNGDSESSIGFEKAVEIMVVKQLEKLDDHTGSHEILETPQATIPVPEPGRELNDYLKLVSAADELRRYLRVFH